MRRGRVWVCRNIIIRMPQGLRIKRYLKSCSHSLSQSSPLIFRVKVWIEIYQVGLCLNSLWVGRSILVQRSKVNLALSSQLKRKQVMETIEAVQGRIVYSKTTPQPSYNTRSYYRLSTSQTSNNCSPPKRHLPPRQYVPDKCGQNHYQLNNYSYKPHKFTWLSIASIIQCTKQMHIYYNEKKRCTISMQVTQKPTIRHITHQMLYTIKCLIYMRSIVHCQKNSSQNLLNQTLTSLNSPIIITILIRRSRITNLMILDYGQNRLIPQGSTQLFHFSSHR